MVLIYLFLRKGFNITKNIIDFLQKLFVLFMSRKLIFNKNMYNFYITVFKKKNLLIDLRLLSESQMGQWPRKVCHYLSGLLSTT